MDSSSVLFTRVFIHFAKLTAKVRVKLLENPPETEETMQNVNTNIYIHYRVFTLTARSGFKFKYCFYEQGQPSTACKSWEVYSSLFDFIKLIIFDFYLCLMDPVYLCICEVLVLS